MGQETRREIDRLERRLAELRAQEEQEKVTVRVRGGRGTTAPMPGPEEPPPPPLPKLEGQVEVHEAPSPERTSASSPRKRAPRRKRPDAKKAKRLERAVIAIVVAFFGGCMALVSTQGDTKDAEDEKTVKAAPKGKPSADEEGEAPPEEDDDNLAPDPGGVCQMLVSAGVAKSCSASETAGEGERVAVFELAGDKGGTGRVRTFDSTARCQQAGGPGGGHWYARCDALTAIVIPSHADAEGTLAARRVAARL